MYSMVCMVSVIVVLNPIVVYAMTGYRTLAGFALLLDVWLLSAVASGVWYLRRQRRAGLWLMVGFACTLLPALVAAEVLWTLLYLGGNRLLAEVLDIYMDDPVLVYAHRPNARGRHASFGNFDVEYVIDGYGRKAIPPRPEATRTIHVFGDSFTFGYGVANEATWLNRLQEKMGPEVSVLNYGTIGYGLEQMYLYLARSIDQIKAGDVVISAPITLDLERNLIGKFYVCGGLIGSAHDMEFPVLENGEWRQASLREECNVVFDALLANSRFPIGFGAMYRGLGHTVRRAEMIANADRIFVLADRLVAGRDASFHLVFLATPEECARGAHSLDLAGLATPYASFLPRCPDDPEAVQALKFPGDGHWSPAGHAWAAQVLYEMLEELPQDAKPGGGGEPGAVPGAERFGSVVRESPLDGHDRAD